MYSMNREYWKRYFDDENRNKVQSWQPMQTKPHPFLKRKSKTVQWDHIQSLRKELETYKNILQEEKQYQDTLICKLHKEQSKNRIMRVKLENIKKNLLS